MQPIQWKINQNLKAAVENDSLEFLSENEVLKAFAFHNSFPVYSATPLQSLRNLASYLGVAGIYIKDESYRFNLNSFKVLGATYAIGKILAKRVNRNIEDLSFELFRSPELKQQLGHITFTTATDGNHGRAVAWAAREFHQKAIIYMPKGSSAVRLDNIKATGAEAYITDLNYDDTVRLAAEHAEKYDRVLLQDTAWTGYEQIPKWIMQGYASMGIELINQFKEIGIEKPTHVFLQAGVGSFAGAMQGVFTSLFGDSRPVTVIVEPDKADCFFQSAKSSDGRPKAVTGDLNTIMAGLACGEPNPIAWEILKDYSQMFISCPDYTAAFGMRILGNPLGNDPRVISGESGAVTTGLLSLILLQEELIKVRQTLDLNQNSRILLISTEGDTDPNHYRKVVWDGAYQTTSVKG